MIRPAKRSERQPHWGWVLGSLVVALALALVPVTGSLRLIWPDWVALVLIYWCVALPSSFGPGAGWLVGIVQDATQFALLGQNALGKSVLAWSTSRLAPRIRLLPVWQQGVAVFALLVLVSVIDAAVRWFALGVAPTFHFLVSSLVGAALARPLGWLLALHRRPARRALR